jgi:hypothetical protein
VSVSYQSQVLQIMPGRLPGIRGLPGFAPSGCRAAGSAPGLEAVGFPGAIKRPAKQSAQVVLRLAAIYLLPLQPLLQNLAAITEFGRHPFLLGKALACDAKLQCEATGVGGNGSQLGPEPAAAGGLYGGGWAQGLHISPS